MRTPMPRYSSGTVRSFGLEVETGLDREDVAFVKIAEVVLVAGVRAIVHVEAQHVTHAVQRVAAVQLAVLA